MDYEKIVLKLLDRVKSLEQRLKGLEQMIINPTQLCVKEEINKTVLEGNCVKSSYNKVSQVDSIVFAISKSIDDAINKGLDHIVVESGELHRALGLKNRIPSVCSAMRKAIEMDERIKNSEVLKDTPSHNSSTYTIRYDF